MPYKIVINRCYGGFSLSEAAQKCLGVSTPYPNIPRHDHDLVRTVELLGEKANGRCARLEVRTINSPLYRIQEYDGMEAVETPDSISWIKIPEPME